MKVKVKENEAAQSCPTLCDPVDCSPPGSSLRGILQARILEWVAISFSRRSSQPRDRTQVSRTAGGRFIIWATVSEILTYFFQVYSPLLISSFSDISFCLFILIDGINTLATWCEELTHWKRPWCWERLKAEGKGDNRGWDGRVTSLTRWTRVWASSRSWWWTGKPGMLQNMRSQRVGQNSATELNWTDIIWYFRIDIWFENIFIKIFSC